MKSKKRSTIFSIFLLPLIAIMLVQSVITIGTLVVRRTAETLEGYSSNMMGRLVENRRVILQNDMVQRWSSIHRQDVLIDSLLEQFLTGKGVELEDLLRSKELRGELLEQLFPECLDLLHGSSTTGLFLVLTGPDMDHAADFDGFFIRDSDPDTSPANYTDLLLERGDKQLSRTWDIPLDSGWSSRFHMSGQGADPAQDYFYEPWRAGSLFPTADTEDLGYWSMPFSLGPDSYQMISYSLPLRHEGTVYGVLGVEISCRELYDYFPVTELNDTQQSGYMLTVREEDGGYIPLVGKGILCDTIRSAGERFTLQDTGYDGLSLVQAVQADGEGIYAVVCPLELYSNNVPYEHTGWALLGLDTEQDLFGMSRQLYVWMVIAVLAGLGFGVIGLYFMVRHLTQPVQRLMQCISQGERGLKEFKPSNILEIDALYDVIAGLMERQKEAENILLEEKERYKVALESSTDIFFSYDLRSQMLDIVNHKSMSGQWYFPKSESGLIDPGQIYEADREAAAAILTRDADEYCAEFRMRWPDEPGFTWVALTAKTVCDTDGRRWKLVGSVRNIQEQKDREAEQLRRSTTDGATGLLSFSAGLEEMQERRRRQPAGVMAVLFLDQLKETGEKNGTVFSDMILEETGGLVRRLADGRTAAMRLDRDEIALWLEGRSQDQARTFIQELLDRAETILAPFRVRMYAGLACGETPQATEHLIRMARLAWSSALSGGGPHALFFDAVPQKDRAVLPALQGHEIGSPGSGRDMSLVSVALDLFGKGTDFSAQMLLMIRKIGRACHASGVLVSLLRADFSSNYLEHQWHRDGAVRPDTVRKYREADKERFLRWLGRDEVRSFTAEDSADPAVRCFLSVDRGEHGVLLPMYDSGQYMGNICILGIGQGRLDGPEGYQDLAELGRVIQGQLNQQRHDIASRAKSEFLSRMSHEIRTPMNGIIGMTAIALQQGQAPDRILDCLHKIQSSSNYLLGLINDILDMSKIESGKMKLEPVDLDMDEALDTIRELIAPQASAKSIEFVQDVRLAHRWFRADRMRISQVLINLLGNAVKFTPAQGRIVLTVREEDGGADSVPVYFAVSDTGTGIPKEDQERVFRSFEQSSSSAKQQGTGLGLSISSRLVQMMGSTIQLDSEPGRGSTFSFTIPLALGQSTEAEAHQPPPSFAGSRVLVVEDNALNAEIAQCLLEERDLKVDCVYDGAQAVERIRSTPPGTYDAILMDIMMPVMDGLEATRTIRALDREDCRTIPIIAMSANAFDDDLKRSVECGMNGHLSKPVDVDKLYQALDQAIRRGTP